METLKRGEEGGLKGGASGAMEALSRFLQGTTASAETAPFSGAALAAITTHEQRQAKEAGVWCKPSRAWRNSRAQMPEVACDEPGNVPSPPASWHRKKTMDRFLSLQVLAAPRKTELPPALPAPLIYRSYCGAQGPRSGSTWFGIV